MAGRESARSQKSKRRYNRGAPIVTANRLKLGDSDRIDDGRDVRYRGGCSPLVGGRGRGRTATARSGGRVLRGLPGGDRKFWDKMAATQRQLRSDGKAYFRSGRSVGKSESERASENGAGKVGRCLSDSEEDGIILRRPGGVSVPVTRGSKTA